VVEPLLVLIRHGDVDGGHHVLWGRRDVALTAEGRRQVHALKPALAALQVSRLVTSPCRRASESAALLADALALIPALDAGFDEFDYGDWAGRTFGELGRDRRWLSFNRERRDRSAAPGGETVLDFRVRVRLALDDLLGQAHGVTCVVTHAEVVRTIVLDALGLQPGAWSGVTIPPASVTLLRGSSRPVRVLGVGLAATDTAALMRAAF